MTWEELAAQTGRIVPWAAYGRHIDLTCRNHPDLRWSTKNIGSIGQRTIFFDLMGKIGKPECSCKLADLVPVVPENWESKIVDA